MTRQAGTKDIITTRVHTILLKVSLRAGKPQNLHHRLDSRQPLRDRSLLHAVRIRYQLLRGSRHQDGTARGDLVGLSLRQLTGVVCSA